MGKKERKEMERRNISVQTASLQYFGVISKSCSFVNLDQIKHILK